MQDGLQAMVARIDERTEHMEGDIKEVKETCKCLTQTVNEYGQDIATIKGRLNGASNCHEPLTRKQKASAGGAIVAFVAAVIVAITEWLKGH